MTSTQYVYVKFAGNAELPPGEFHRSRIDVTEYEQTGAELVTLEFALDVLHQHGCDIEALHTRRQLSYSTETGRVVINCTVCNAQIPVIGECWMCGLQRA